MKNKKGFWQGALCGALAMLLVAGLVSCGLKLNIGGSNVDMDSVEEKLETIKYLIDEKYLGDVDEEALEQGIYEGYVYGLDDPYSVYYDEEDTQALLESTSGEYSGIGAVLTQDLDTGIITLVRIYDESPAMKAGLEDNDILYKVGEMEVTGKDLSEVVTYIKGEKGTEVELTVLRGDQNEEITVPAVRDTIEVETVEYEMLENNIGYIAVTEFDTVTYEQYEAALADLESQGMESLVVDLRGNPGGSRETVCNMLDLMLPEGMIVYTEDKDGNRDKHKSDEAHQFTKPLTVLVNQYSASASEIYAGAIQDYGIGEIVGTQTYGKGVVQQLFDLKDGTCLKITVSEYFTPNGRNIHGEGIAPDVVCEYEYDENNPEADNQLNEAVKVLKEKMN